jgi:LPXTG-motif cell wall-anchored protein
METKRMKHMSERRFISWIIVLALVAFSVLVLANSADAAADSQTVTISHPELVANSITGETHITPKIEGRTGNRTDIKTGIIGHFLVIEIFEQEWFSVDVSDTSITAAIVYLDGRVELVREQMFSALRATPPQVCPEGGEWTAHQQVAGEDTLEYTYQIPDGFEVVETCIKVGSHDPLIESVDPPATGEITVKNTTLFNPPGNALQGISHVSFKLAEREEEPSPTTTTTPEETTTTSQPSTTTSTTVTVTPTTEVSTTTSTPEASSSTVPETSSTTTQKNPSPSTPVETLPYTGAGMGIAALLGAILSISGLSVLGLARREE